MSTAVKKANPRWISHRIAAHRMNQRGQSLDAIADALRVTKRSVCRYLALPVPEPLSAEPEVDLVDFYLDGACNEFPEYDWLSRRPSVQAECKAICQYCPVLQKCRTWGLTKGRFESGIYGGLTKNERVVISRKNAAEQQRGTAATSDDQQGAA